MQRYNEILAKLEELKQTQDKLESEKKTIEVTIQKTDGTLQCWKLNLNFNFTIFVLAISSLQNVALQMQ